MSTATPTPRDSTTARAPQLRGWVEVFKAGQHTDSKGRSFSASTDDLDQVVSNHTLGRVPAVIGHPKEKDPAYAWVNECKRDGDSLFVRFADINPAFDDGVLLGAYRNRSLSLYRDPVHGLRMRHVGWLGAVPPAIDGLAANGVEFSDGDADVFEFAGGDEEAAQSLSWAIDSIGSLLRGMRDHLIEQESVEVADRVMPSWQIDSVINQAQAARQALAAEAEANNPMFSHPVNGDPSMTTITQEQLDAQVAAARAEGERLAQERLTQQFSAQGQELSELRAARKQEVITGHINALKAKGLITPADEAGLAEFMSSLEASGEFTFSAAGAETKKQPIDWFVDFMSKRSPVVKLGHRLPGDGSQVIDANDADAVGKAAHDFQRAEAEAGREVSIEHAVQHIVDQLSKA